MRLTHSTDVDIRFTRQELQGLYEWLDENYEGNDPFVQKLWDALYGHFNERVGG